MSPELKTTQFPRSSTKQATSRSGRRNRRKAKDLSDPKLREIKGDFEQTRDSMAVAQGHLLPRAEAVDAVMARIIEEFNDFRSEMVDLRRQLGLGGEARPFLVRRTA